MMRVVMVGQVCIDQNITEQENYTGWGSALMYMAHYYKEQLAIAPTLIAPYGEDFLRYGEGVRLLPKPQVGPTLVYKNETNVYPRRWHCLNAGSAEPVELTAQLKEVIRSADIIYLAPLLPNYSASYVEQLLDAKNDQALSVLQAAGYLRRVLTDGTVSQEIASDFDNSTKQFDLVFLSDDDIPKALEMAASWAKRLSTDFIVTQGELGATWFSGDGKVLNLEAQVVPDDQIIDSVGCGDVFCAAASFNYFHHRDIGAALRAGNYDARQKLMQSRVGQTRR